MKYRIFWKGDPVGYINDEGYLELEDNLELDKDHILIPILITEKDDKVKIGDFVIKRKISN